MTATSNTVLIRPTIEEDWETLKTISLAALLDSPAAFGLSYAVAATYSDQQWRERASSDAQSRFLMAIEQGQPVGRIGDAIRPSGEYNLIAMWTHPNYRGMGIGSRLVKAIQARATELGYRRVVLSVSPENVEAVNLYRRQGFEFLSEWEPLASQPGVNVQRMEWKCGS